MSSFNLKNQLENVPETETFLRLEGKADDLYKDEGDYKSVTLVDEKCDGDEVLTITVDSLNPNKEFHKFNKLLGKRIRMTVEIFNQ